MFTLVFQNSPNTFQEVWKEPLKAEPQEVSNRGEKTPILTKYLED